MILFFYIYCASLVLVGCTFFIISRNIINDKYQYDAYTDALLMKTVCKFGMWIPGVNTLLTLIFLLVCISHITDKCK